MKVSLKKKIVFTARPIRSILIYLYKKKSQIDNLNILNILVIIIVIKSPTLIIGYRSLLAKVAFFPLYFVMQVSNSRISIDPWKIDNV